MSETERALLAAILAAPGDDTPRLVYADWLDEHGRSEQAAIIRCDYWRLGGNPAGHHHFLKHYPDLCDRLVYLPGATPEVIALVRCGVVFLMAWWSGPARQAFAALVNAVRRGDLGGRVLIVVIDIDGVDESFNSPFESHPHAGYVRLVSGAGEASWVIRGRSVRATWYDTPPSELRQCVLFLANSYDGES